MWSRPTSVLGRTKAFSSSSSFCSSFLHSSRARAHDPLPRLSGCSRITVRYFRNSHIIQQSWRGGNRRGRGRGGVRGGGGMLQKAKESMYNIDATIARWSRNIFSHNNSSQVVPILIGTNIGVWSLWNFWGLKDTQNYHFMMDHFTISLKNLQEGRIHTLLTSAFSQISTDHILLNCLTIYFLGSGLQSAIGTKRFLAVYMGGAIFSSLVHVIYQNVILQQSLQNHRQRYGNTLSGYSRRESTDRPALGASGAGRAISIAFAMLNPQATFLLYFFIPCPAWAVAGALIGLDLYSLNQELNTKGQGAGAGRGVAHAAHLGGAVFGIMSAVALRRMSGFRSMF